MRTSPRFFLSSAALLPLFAVGCFAEGHDEETFGRTESALFASGPVEFVGRGDKNWFNPRNWSTGRVPGPNDDVVLDGDDDVLVDPTARGGSETVTIRDLEIRGSARLEVIGGVVFRSRHEIVADHGQRIFRASPDLGESLVVDGEGISLSNPKSISRRDLILKTSVTMDVGIGGLTPASFAVDAAGAPVVHAGPGHYSTATADTLAVDGHLRISLYYGFEPRPGDTFQIMTANRSRSGEFVGLPEGSFVGCTENAVCLRISYEGGDGDDVVLTAEQVEPEVAALLPAIQKHLTGAR